MPGLLAVPEENTGLYDTSPSQARIRLSLGDEYSCYHVQYWLFHRVPRISQAGRVVTSKAAEAVAGSTLPITLCFEYVVFRRGRKKIESVMETKNEKKRFIDK